MTKAQILIHLFRTLDDAIHAEHNQAGTRPGNTDRLLQYNDLWHAACPRYDPTRRPIPPAICQLGFPELCQSPYAELLRLTRRPGPMHAAAPHERWHVMQRHRWCDRRPIRAKLRSGRYTEWLPHIGQPPIPIARNQAVIGDDGTKKRGSNHPLKAPEWQLVTLETWTPKVDPLLVATGLTWLGDNYRVPLQLPDEIRRAVAA